MKKLSAFLLILIMVFSMIPLAFAEDEDPVPTLISADGTEGNDTDDEEGDNEDADEDGSDEDETDEEDTEEDDADEEETEVDESEEETYEEEATEEETEEVEEEAIDATTESETVLISDSKLGAKLRVLQLKKAILKAVLTSEVVIEVLQESGQDVSDLESILAEMNVIKDEVDALDYESESIVDDFVNIKRDIKDLSTDFKGISRPIVTENDVADIRTGVREAFANSQELADLNDEIKATRCELNAERVLKALERLGTEDSELVDKVQNCEATAQEVKDALRKGWNDLPEGQKRAAKLKVAARLNKMKAKTAMAVKRIKENHIKVRKERLQDRIDKVKVKRDAVKNRIKTKINKFERVNKKLVKEVRSLKKQNQVIKKRVVAKRREGAGTGVVEDSGSTEEADDGPTEENTDAASTEGGE